MEQNHFEQTTSYTKRLRRTLIIIAVFFLFGVVTNYYSSWGFLTGLQQINTANRIMNLAALTLEGLNTSDQNLNKIRESKDLKNIQYTFRQSQKVIHRQIDEASKIAEDFPAVLKMLQESRQALDQYEKAVDEIFIRLRQEETAQPNQDMLLSELVTAGEYSTDAKEGLRKIQIRLRDESNSVFTSIYDHRFDPLLLGSFISILFFSFVIIVGLSSAKRLSKALGNLTSATDAVAKGDLTFRAPILEPDEFGNLTYEFNGMVKALDENQAQLNLVVERVTRLQRITSALSEAMSAHQVYEVIFKEGFAALDLSAGAIALLDSEKKEIHLQRAEGYDSQEVRNWSRFPLSADVPSAHSIREEKAIYLSSLDEIFSNYPLAHDVYHNSNVKASAFIPLMVEGRSIGAVVFSYDRPKEFDGAEREFLQALVNQCAQALHRAQLYDAAREAIKVRDEFLSIASHELRTPLTPLKLQLQNLSRQVKKGKLTVLSPEQLLRTVESSDRQVNRLTNLIDDLLDVSRISAGKLTLNFENFNLAEMVEEVVSQYTHQLNEIDSTVSVEVDRSLNGNFDKVRVEQVFINLLTNAAKYAPGKPIEVKLSRHGEKARLSVKDEGQGISPENQKRIFDRFERVRDRDNVGGLGLGLYISRQIVEAHQGRIWVESTPGAGATFIVELPLNSAT